MQPWRLLFSGQTKHLEAEPCPEIITAINVLLGTDVGKLLLQPSQTFRSTPGTSNMYPDCTRWPLREILDFDDVTDALVRAVEKKVSAHFGGEYVLIEPLQKGDPCYDETVDDPPQLIACGAKDL